MEAPFRFTFRAMASGCEIAIAGLERPRAEALAAAAEAEVRRIERKYSRFLPDSELSRINARAAVEAVTLDDETAALLDYADRLHQLSDGLFDVTTAPLQQAWDFRARRMPSQAELDAILPRIGWSHVVKEGSSVRFDAHDVRIDLGGFGKEYAADRAAEVIAAAGATSGYVNLGGDIRAIGPKPDGSPWTFGIRHPRQEHSLVASIPVSAGGLATSGDYERYFEIDGRRYCHVLSPRSGMPVNYWQSVSVLAPRAITAGATTTIAMLKESEGLAFLRACGLPFLAIDREGRAHTHKDSD